MINKRKRLIFPAIILAIVLLSLGSSAQLAGTCTGSNGRTYCGGKSPSSDCYCDAICSTYGDCCSDYKSVCLKTESSTEPQNPISCPTLSPQLKKEGCSYTPKYDDNGCTVGYNEVCPGACSDTDGGYNTAVKGTVKYYSVSAGESGESTSGYETATDNCYNYESSAPGPCSGNSPGCVLVENYCGKEGSPIKEKYTCPNGCKDGACIAKGNECSSNPYSSDCTCPKGFVRSPVNQECPSGFACPAVVAYKCVSIQKDTCGNGICDATEKKCTTICPPCASSEKCQCKEVCEYTCKADCVPKPVCGNNKCEDGEADHCPACGNSNPPCMAPCKVGTCPADCKKKSISKQDVIDYINGYGKISKEDAISYVKGNCYDSKPASAQDSGSTGEQIKIAPIILGYS